MSFGDGLSYAISVGVDSSAFMGHESGGDRGDSFIPVLKNG